MVKSMGTNSSTESRIPLSLNQASPVDSPRPKHMWPVWLLFFFQYAGVGVFFTYLNMFFRSAGLSGTQIGVINMVTALVGVASVTGWGYLSDLTGKNRYLIAIGAGGALLVAQFIPWINSFTGFLALGSLGSMLSAAPATLVDSTTLGLLGSRREDYGRYRMGGSLGYIITALSAGFIFDRVGMRWMFPIYGIIMTLFALTALRLPDAPPAPQARAKGDIAKLVRQPVWIIFTLSIFLAWIAVNASIQFMGVSLQSMGASQSLVGIAVTIGAITEVPFMLYSGPLLRRFGAVRLLLVGMSIMVVRFFLLGWMPSPEWAIPINMLNGPAFVFFWNSAITYLNKMATAATASTAQGLLNSTMSLAGVVSSLLTGWLFDQLGPNGLYTVMGFCCLGALIVFGAGTSLNRNAAPQPAPKSE
jgi:MFS transporter, PPP family, 3-phenylpropionic acid transporter